MKTFVINLDKNINRMSYMDEQLKRLDIEYERIPAVYGAHLSKEERKKNFSAFRSFCATGYRMRDGEIGCALSHCKIYKKMVEDKISFALICEDDIIIEKEIINVISSIKDFIDITKPQVILLSSHGVKEKKLSGIERIKGGMCTDGYIITCQAAQRILKANYPVITVADKWSRWERYFEIEMYRIWPTVICQDNVKFNTDIAINKYNAPKGIHKLIYKICRTFELSIDWVCYKISGR